MKQRQNKPYFGCAPGSPGGPMNTTHRRTFVFIISAKLSRQSRHFTGLIKLFDTMNTLSLHGIQTICNVPY